MRGFRLLFFGVFPLLFFYVGICLIKKSKDKGTRAGGWILVVMALLTVLAIPLFNVLIQR